MIKRLHLERFGKFSGRVFEFSPVTLFFGANEAGKTTVFDALLDALCAPKATTVPGRMLRARYGGERLARLEFDGEELSVPAEDFLNLFAIRSGNVSLEIEKDSEWMTRVKAELFSGGIDPRAAARILDSDLQSRRKGTLTAEAISLKESVSELGAKLDKAKAERRECLAEESRIAAMDERREEASGETGRLVDEVEVLEAELNQQNLLREEKSLNTVLTRLSAKKTAEESLGRYDRYSREGHAELRRREERITTLAADAVRARTEREAAETAFRRLLEEKTRAEEEKNRLERARVVAEVLKRSLEDVRRLVERKIVVTWRRPMLAAAAVLLGCGAAVFLSFPVPYSLTGLVAFAAASTAAVLFAARRTVVEDTERLDEALRGARESWYRETGESLPQSLEAVLPALDRAAERAQAASARFEAGLKSAAEGESRIAALNSASRKADADLDEARRELRRILDAVGAEDTADYSVKLTEKKNLRERLSEIEAFLRDAALRFGDAPEADLEGIVSRRITEIRERVTMPEMTENEVRRKENLLREKRIRLAGLREEEKSALGNFHHYLGAVRARFKGLPETIAVLEKEIAVLNRRLREIETERKAMEIAKGIFLSLAEDSDSMLSELSREIASVFSRLVAEERSVVFRDLSSDSALAADADGVPRETAQLSAGTLNAFILAARLVLARTSSTAGGKALIVLDEPFLALDRTRTEKALDIVKDFHDATGWQVVFFTKDETLLNLAVRVFGPKMRVHEPAKA